jgi:hypothetical protein
LAGHQHAPLLLLTHREALHPDTVAALESSLLAKW